MDTKPAVKYVFGEFSLHCEDGTLWRKEERVPITQKAVEMLTVLLQNQGRVVTRDEMIEHLWPDTFVDENNLSVTVSMLRKAFGESADSPKFIETIPRKGYRFNGEVISNFSGDLVATREFSRTLIEKTEIDDAEATLVIAGLHRRSRIQFALTATVAVLIAAVIGFLAWSYKSRDTGTVFAGSSQKSIAVLPFRDLSNDERGRQLSIGLADELVTRFASIKGLSVRPMSSVSHLDVDRVSARSIGEKLKVDAVLEGTIQRDGENFRVSVRLIDVSSEQVLWANVLQQNADDLFAFQRQLSLQVADALSFRLSGEEREHLARRPTQNPEAFRSYLLGRFYLGKRTVDDLRTSLTHFERATSLDASFAEAHAANAAATMLLSDSSFAGLLPKEAVPRARSSALKAIELDDSIAEAYAVLGSLQMNYDWDIVESERSLRRAIEKNSSYATAYQWLAWNLIVQRRTSEAEDALRRAAELDPVSLSIAADQGYPAFFAGDYERAEADFRNALPLDPSYPSSLLNIWRAQMYGGKFEAAASTLETILSISGSDHPVYLMARGVTLAKTGKKAEAEAIYSQLRRRQQAGEYIARNFTVTLAVELERTDDVFSDLEGFLSDRNDYTIFLMFAPEFERVRNDPRFVDIWTRAGVKL